MFKAYGELSLRILLGCTLIFALSAPQSDAAPLWCERFLINHGWIKAVQQAPDRASSYGSVKPEGKRVHVKLPGQKREISYHLTDRDPEGLIRTDLIYPDYFIRRSGLLGKKIVDLACGGGSFVEVERANGVDIIGVDVNLTPYQLSRPYFVHASAHDTGLPSKSFDIVFSAWGPFFYLSVYDERAMIEGMLTEAHRLLKTGGVLRISPIHVVDHNEYRKYGGRPEIDFKGMPIQNLPPGLRVRAVPTADWFTYSESELGESHTANYWVEFERVD